MNILETILQIVGVISLLMAIFKGGIWFRLFVITGILFLVSIQ